MNILCRLGLHSWKPVFCPIWPWRNFVDFPHAYVQVSCKCRRCGKRVDV